MLHMLKKKGAKVRIQFKMAKRGMYPSAIALRDVPELVGTMTTST